MSRFGLGLAIAMFAASLPARADDLPDAAAILAHVRAATGPDVPAYHETIDETSTGLVEHVVVAHAGGDERRESDVGALHAASGISGGRRWRQNFNGETIFESPDPGVAKTDAFVATVERTADPPDGYVLSSLDARGYGTKRYVDSATWRVVRSESIRAAATTIARYDDFRTVAGRTFAFEESIDDGRAEDARVVRVTRFDAGAVAPREVAIPGSRRTFVEFPLGTTTVDLPVRYEAGRFIVHVTVGSRGLDLMLDSGSAGIVLDEGVVRELGLPTFGSFSNAANAGRFRETFALVPRMDVGALTMRDVAIGTVPALSIRGFSKDYRVVGLLGFDFIDAVRLKLDYVARKVTATDPSVAAPPDDPTSFALPVRLGSGTPLVDATVNGALGERFILDTGAVGSLVLFDRFVRRNATALVDEGGGENRDLPLRGVGGPIAIRPLQIRTIGFGPAALHDYVVYAITDRRAYDDGADGSIGPDVLHLFDVTFDYAHGDVRFDYNAIGRQFLSPSP
jgi:hypothetical protein